MTNTYKYPNVLIEREDDKPEIANTIHPFLAPLVDAIAVKYPMWQLFAVQGHAVNDTTCEIFKFAVYDDSNPRERIGVIGTTKRYHKDKGLESVYTISCVRLAKSRDRGSELRTKDLAVAMKAIKQHFEPPSRSELMDEFQSSASMFIRSMSGRYSNHVLGQRSKVMPLMYSFINSNWDSFTSTLAAADREEVDSLFEAEKVLMSVRELDYAINADKVLTVLTEGDKYVVRYDGRLSMWESGTLPDEVRRRIGQLKLTDVNVVVEDVGVRTERGFIVLLPDGFTFNHQ